MSRLSDQLGVVEIFVRPYGDVRQRQVAATVLSLWLSSSGANNWSHVPTVVHELYNVSIDDPLIDIRVFSNLLLDRISERLVCD